MAMKVAEAAGNQLHILYVGKRNITEQISKNISTIMKEKLSHSLQDVFQCLRDFDLWKRHMNGKDFLITLNHNLPKSLLIRVMESPHMDNMEVLKALTYAEKDQLPLQEHGSSKVESQYKVVWIPVVDKSTQWTQAKQHEFENHQSSMPWKFTGTAAVVAKAVKIPLEILYVGQSNLKIEIHSNISSIINQEKLNHAFQGLHLVWFLWVWLENMLNSKKQLGCTVENDPVMQKIDTMLSYDKSNRGWAVFWKESAMAMAMAESKSILLENQLPLLECATKRKMAEENYICFCGGENIDWIRNFTATAQKVAEATGIQLQILYIGKSSPKDQIRKIISTITVEKLSHSLQTSLRGSTMTMAKSEIILQCSRDFGLCSEGIDLCDEKECVVPHFRLGGCRRRAIHAKVNVYRVSSASNNDRESVRSGVDPNYGQHLGGMALERRDLANRVLSRLYNYSHSHFDISTAHKVAEVACIRLKILYVGKSNSKKQVCKNIYTITVEKLSHSLQDYHQVWFFWERL
ncbi:hypothetical protein Patl1_33316 [Pistacia atlantica]|uniref:Uncharacterized protein n=1 Tax=Pistacia atlantica TaxID=434234 RepID=A0ACC0ZRK7_9ROSI|nr:hypothetical protein Patl1_33316 [Pistacia atlantica]